MTGAEHYREGEQLLAAATAYRGEQLLATVMATLALAQAHATLALAAATALASREDRGDRYTVLADDDYQAWWRAASEGPAARQRRKDAELDDLLEGDS
jgi:hypothetical protein